MTPLNFRLKEEIIFLKETILQTTRKNDSGTKKKKVFQKYFLHSDTSENSSMPKKMLISWYVV